jgi:hypothetical protein
MREIGNEQETNHLTRRTAPDAPLQQCNLDLRLGLGLELLPMQTNLFAQVDGRQLTRLGALALHDLRHERADARRLLQKRRNDLLGRLDGLGVVCAHGEQQRLELRRLRRIGHGRETRGRRGYART